MNDLERLRQRLDGAIGGGRKLAARWGSSARMAVQLAELRKRYGHLAGNADAAQAMPRVADFLRSGEVAGIADLNALCLAAAWFDDEGRCLLADAVRLGELLAMAEVAPGRRNRLKLFRSLLRAYWVFPLHAREVGAAKAGWLTLRAWLGGRYAALERQPGRKPGWFVVLSRYLHLLADDPCRRYGEALLRGDASELRQATVSLRIPEEAWVKDEAILAQVAAAGRLDDAAFCIASGGLLDIAAGRAGIAVGEPLARRIVAALLARHARCRDYQPHSELFLAAVDLLGPPWANRAAWDALVVDAQGEPSSAAREMVAVWLKDSLIDGYFAGNTAAAELWKKYAVFTAAIWLAMDAGAANGALRACARRCRLVLAADGERAMLMRFGAQLVVLRSAAPDWVEVFRWTDVGPEAAASLRQWDRPQPFDIAALVARTPLAARLDARNLAHLDARLKEILLGRG